MSDLTSISLRPDYRAQLVGMFPRVTAAQIMRFADLVATDRLVTDDGEPHPALEEWIARVLGGDEPAPETVPAAPPPRPVPGSSAVEVPA